MAAHLALMGFKVTLYNRTFERIQVIQNRGGLDLESGDYGPRGFGKLQAATADMSEALAKAQVIMVVTPSSAHADIARTAAPRCSICAIADFASSVFAPLRLISTICPAPLEASHFPISSPNPRVPPVIRYVASE